MICIGIDPHNDPDQKTEMGFLPFQKKKQYLTPVWLVRYASFRDGECKDSCRGLVFQMFAVNSFFWASRRGNPSGDIVPELAYVAQG